MNNSQQMGDESDYGSASQYHLASKVEGRMGEGEKGIRGEELTYASFDVYLPLGKEVLQVFHSQLHEVSPQRGAFV